MKMSPDLIRSFGISALAFGIPFLVIGSCDDVTSCGAAAFRVIPMLLVVLPIAGFAVGWMGPTWLSFLGVVAGAVFISALGSLVYRWQIDASGVELLRALLVGTVVLAGLALVLLLMGFVLGVGIAGWRRRRHTRSRV